MNGTGASRKSSILLGKICPGTKDGFYNKETNTIVPQKNVQKRPKTTKNRDHLIIQSVNE
jgi:hypothetical protein